jgi:hypothetical protein
MTPYLVLSDYGLWMPTWPYGTLGGPMDYGSPFGRMEPQVALWIMDAYPMEP